MEASGSAGEGDDLSGGEEESQSQAARFRRRALPVRASLGSQCAPRRGLRR